MNVGIIGCGNMGGGMAKTLHKNQINILAFDLNEALTDALKLENIRIAQSTKEIAEQCSIIILSLPNAKIVQAVMNELHNALNVGTVIIDTSTSEPNVTIELAKKAADNKYHFVDAPVSGGPLAANSGNMTMLLGGDPIAIEKAQPIFDILAGKQVYLGASGSAHTAKIANNLLCAANLVLVGEMVQLCESLNIDPTLVLEGVNAGSGRSGVSELNFEKWILNDAFDSGFTMGLMRKDVNLATSLMEENGLNLSATQKIADIWNASKSQISDDSDFNEIVKYGENK